MSPSEALQEEIRASRPAAPPELRERVRLVAAQEPAREPWLARLSARRFLLVAAPATLVVALAAAGVIGLTRPGSSDESAVSSGVARGDAAATTESFSAESASPAPPAGSDAVAPDPGRLQRYDAQLDLRVDGLDDLSAATQRAMRVARSLGGHVQTVSYDAPSAGVGSAQMTLRVPIARVQSALVQLSSLGTIVGQRFGIQDLQGTADDLAAQIAETQRQIAELNRLLRNPDLVEEERVVLQARLAEARSQLSSLRAALGGTREEARFATIQLSLTTERLTAAPAEEGALDRVVDILRWEGLAALYVLVVAGPILLLGLLVWLALRLRRRREEERLLAK